MLVVTGLHARLISQHVNETGKASNLCVYIRTKKRNKVSGMSDHSTRNIPNSRQSIVIRSNNKAYIFAKLIDVYNSNIYALIKMANKITPLDCALLKWTMQSNAMIIHFSHKT